jgi:hypothetical protein
MVTFIVPQRRNAFITVHIFEHGRLVHGMYKIHATHTLVPVQKQGPADMAMARLCTSTNTRNFKNTMFSFIYSVASSGTIRDPAQQHKWMCRSFLSWINV